jgi:hypothetical protein
MSKRNKYDLRLHEQVMLIALSDRHGTIESAAMHYPFALAGAVLAELILAHRILLTADKKPVVEVVSSAPLNDPVLDHCLERIEKSKRRHQALTWVTTFAHLSTIRKQTLLSLCDHGIIKEDPRTVLLFFTRRLYPEIDPRPERQMADEIRRVVLADKGLVKPRTGLLIALANAVQMLPVYFDRKQLKERQQRISEITSGDALGKPTQEAVAAAQQALRFFSTAALVTS